MFIAVNPTAGNAVSDHGAANAAAIAEFEPLPDLSADSRRLGIIPGFNDGE